MRIDKSRVLLNVATKQFVKGQNALATAAIAGNFLDGASVRRWCNALPAGSPSHEAVPYAFKAYALKVAEAEGYTSLLWCDASVVPIRSLGPLWAQIERDGYWIARNGWDNSDWTADSAYADLFPGVPLETARLMNKQIPHVVGTAFGLDISHPIGFQFMNEYFRLAQTKAFCGPWKNEVSPAFMPGVNQARASAPCGPPSTLGHRHDQTALSVLAHRFGMKLTDGPHVFAYALRDAAGNAILDPARYQDDTMLLAVGI